ncbi:MFS general substrate transporter [Acrodontium crateriforme]|uniref:Cercosporin MFS transporter CTB4 n=1 Tax=Acrodontium crateriforme TaxID=150365 RepID=A0AAQ3MC47_9PEZI|nr:MFS general substrate transporter [Acrodontium crateriforme]
MNKGASTSLAAEYDLNIVTWDGPNDLDNPVNWSRSRKWASTLALGFTTFCVTFASSVFSSGTEAAAKEFGVSTEIMIFATALFVLGFACGPIVWGPLSELYGRKLPLFTGLACFAVFQIPCAMAPNLGTLLLCRFIGGFFGCAPLSIVGGALADFWIPVDRGIAVSIFSGATFLGPTMGPLVGGYLTQTPGLGWRWTAWVTLFATMFFGSISWFVYPESFSPVLLQRRARRRRHKTKNWAIHAPADEVEINGRALLAKYLSKPFLMLIYEPILLLMTIYISFIYGILYLFFETYPLTFHAQRSWSLGKTGLPFIAVMVGVIAGGVVNFIFVKTRYVRILKLKGRVPPEERLVPMMVGAVALPAGLFIYAWTSDMKSSWPQIVAGAPCGMGIVLIFLQGLNYIIDCYMMYSNSAIAANTFVRSCFGAAFPLFAIHLYRDLGVKWATSLLGFIALGLMPVPVLFFTFGERIRKMSRFTPKLCPGMMGLPGGAQPGSTARQAPPDDPGATPTTITSSHAAFREGGAVVEPTPRVQHDCLRQHRPWSSGETRAESPIIRPPPRSSSRESARTRESIRKSLDRKYPPPNFPAPRPPPIYQGFSAACHVAYDRSPTKIRPGTAIEMPPPARRP